MSIKEKFKNKNFKVASIIIACLVVLSGFVFVGVNYDSLFLSINEKDKIITNTYFEKGQQMAYKKCEELYKFNKKDCDAVKGVILKAEQQKQLAKKQQERVGISNNQNKININDFTISDVKANRDEDERYIYVTGSIKNNGKIPAKYYEIYVDFYDNNGNVVETERTNSTIVLKPNTSNTFKIMADCQNDIKNFKTYVHEVN